MGKSWRLIGVFLGAGVLLLGLLVAADYWLALPEGEVATYVGRDECARCHEKETALWLGSDHHRAMDYATAETVLANFDDQEVSHFGQTTRFFRREGQYFVTTDGPGGEMETFAVKYVLGIHPLQQYLVEFPDGRIQCLPFAWDTVKRRWFHLYPGEEIRHDDVLHWTKPLQNWNYMCADCHTTNLQKNYDLKTNTYRTTWSEINVSCETCHGPGSLHVKLADSWGFFWDRRYGYGLPRLKGKDPRPEIETCAPCHARRRIVASGHQAGRPFLDYYFPELLDTQAYYPDGQILDENYEYGSFLQSRMYAQKVRCSDCHDPHSTRIKFYDPQAPRGTITDNRLCGQCHLPAKYDTPQHHFHPDQSQPGWLCVDCHMPVTYYMVVDPRRDHSFRVPRPDLTGALGIPNACNGCHHDAAKGETPQWAVEKLREWYGTKNEPPHFAHAIAAGRQGKPEAERMLEAICRRQDLSPYVRASALALLGRYGPDASRAAAVRGLEDEDGLVRTMAVRALEFASPQEKPRWLKPVLHDPLRAVRTEAARVLSTLSDTIVLRDFSADDRTALAQALAEYLAGQESLADQAAAHLNMAVIYTNRGQYQRAEEAYHTAIRLDPQFLPARINFAMLYDRLGKKKEAAEELREMIRRAERQHAVAAERAAQAELLREELAVTPPQSPDVTTLQARLQAATIRGQEAAEMQQLLAEGHYALGLLLGEEENQLGEAAEHLATAAELAPHNHRIHYNCGLAQQKLGRHAEAEQALTAALRLAPENADYLFALAVFYLQQQRWHEAAEHAQVLVRRWPDDQRGKALLSEIQRRRRANH